MFNIFKSKKSSHRSYQDNDIVSIVNGKIFPMGDVKDPVFAEKLLGDGIAFELHGDSICSPVNGVITVLFPTYHAFGITLHNGVELLCHIGIDTVKNNGKGFKALVKQGDKIKAGMPIVKLDLELLSKSYDMSTMLIITNSNDKKITFFDETSVKNGDIIGKIDDK